MRLGNTQCRLSAMLLLTILFFMVEIIVGYITNSMALIADSFHMFSDAIALVIAFISVRMSPKKWSKNTFGWARAEILGALVNAVFLCALCFSILIESIKRFMKPDLIHDPFLILIVGGLGLFINLIGLVLFKDGGGHFHHHHGHTHHHAHQHHIPVKESYLVCQGDRTIDDKDAQKYGLLQSSDCHASSQDLFCNRLDSHSNKLSIEKERSDVQLVNKVSLSKIQDDGDLRHDRFSPRVAGTDPAGTHLKYRQLNRQEYDPSSDKAENEHGHEHRQNNEDSQDIKEVQSNHASSGQMNMRGVFLHVMADALGSVIVMISAIVVLYTDWSIRLYIDPILSVLMVCLILRSTWPLLTESAMILLQTVPTHIEVDSLRKRLTQEIHGVLAVHEFHVWQLAGDRIIASAHIRCHNLQDYMRIAEKVKEFFHNEGIHSTTIQPEFMDFDNNEVLENSFDDCVLDCPTQGSNCAPQTCCGVQKTSVSDTTSVIVGAKDDSVPTSSIGRKNLRQDQVGVILETMVIPEISDDDNIQVITSTASV